jgi:septal ring factor EnvC (AmiA/AmiB activator)
MADDVTQRLTQLEEAVQRAGAALGRLRDENARLKRELAQVGEERKQTVTQIDAILKDIAKLEIE